MLRIDPRKIRRPDRPPIRGNAGRRTGQAGVCGQEPLPENADGGDWENPVSGQQCLSGRAGSYLKSGLGPVQCRWFRASRVRRDQLGADPIVFFDALTVLGSQPESQEVSSSHPPRPPELIRIVGIPTAISETPHSGIVRSQGDVTHQTLRFRSCRRNFAHRRGAWGVCVVRRGAVSA